LNSSGGGGSYALVSGLAAYMTDLLNITYSVTFTRPCRGALRTMHRHCKHIMRSKNRGCTLHTMYRRTTASRDAQQQKATVLSSHAVVSCGACTDVRMPFLQFLFIELHPMFPRFHNAAPRTNLDGILPKSPIDKLSKVGEN